jgi:hypothetical protein
VAVGSVAFCTQCGARVHSSDEIRTRGWALTCLSATMVAFLFGLGLWIVVRILSVPAEKQPDLFMIAFMILAFGGFIAGFLSAAALGVRMIVNGQRDKFFLNIFKGFAMTLVAIGRARRGYY